MASVMEYMVVVCTLLLNFKEEVQQHNNKVTMDAMEGLC